MSKPTRKMKKWEYIASSLDNWFGTNSTSAHIRGKKRRADKRKREQFRREAGRE